MERMCEPNDFLETDLFCVLFVYVDGVCLDAKHRV